MTKKKNKTCLKITIPFLLLIPVLYAYLNRQLTLFPGPIPQNYFAYSDSSVHEENNGNSIVTEFTVDSAGISFSYTLRPQYQYPYAGFNIQLRKDKEFFDMSGYDYFVIKLDPANSKAIRILIRTFLDGFTKLDDFLSYRHIIKELDVVPEKKVYKIPLHEFQTAMWWYQEHNTSESVLGKSDLSRVIDIEFESGELAPVNTLQSFKVLEISVQRDTTKIFIFSFIVIAIYFIIYWLSVLFQNRSTKPIIIPYEKLHVESYADVDLRKIVEAIAKRYKEPDLTIGKINEDTGISPNKIASHIQKEFNCNFKQYLNSIRLAEATRLIKETDRQISDIAYLVGYKNVTHFHRVFKQMYSMSPNEYRKQ